MKHHDIFLYEKSHAFLQVHYLAKTPTGFNRRLKHTKKASPKPQKLSFL